MSSPAPSDHAVPATIREAVFATPTREVAAGLLGRGDAIAGAPLTDELAAGLRRMLAEATGSEAISRDLLRDARPFGEVLEISALCAAQRRIGVQG